MRQLSDPAKIEFKEGQLRRLVREARKTRP